MLILLIKDKKDAKEERKAMISISQTILKDEWTRVKNLQ